MPSSVYGTRPPRFERPIALEEHIAALPAGGTVKGMFVRDALAAASVAPSVDLFERAGLEPRRVLPFFDYPYADHMRLLAAACEVCWPREPLGEGLRRLGHRGYETLIGHSIGRVIFAAFGSDFGRVVSVGAKGWKVGVSFGTVEYESLGEGHGAYHMRDLPCFIETYQAGVVEGAMRTCGVDGEVWARVDSLSHGVLEFWWS
ncbi:MAG: DUF2378 family protein [Sandaracinaceae bacterium]|nr:DUF2378 family protein [Sandaracinaceae bacterium]